MPYRIFILRLQNNGTGEWLYLHKTFYTMKRITISRIPTILMWGLIGALLFLIIKIFIVEDYTRWGVLANMLSTILLAIVPLYILCRTRQDDKAKEEYRTKKEDLEKLKKLIAHNYSMLDFESISYAIVVMSVDKIQVLDILLALLRQVETQSHQSDLNMPYSNDEKCVNDYLLAFESCLTEYGRFIDDMILACGIELSINAGECTKSYIDRIVVTMTKLIDTSPLAAKYIFAEGGLLSRLKEIQDGENYIDAVQSSIEGRRNDLRSLYKLKDELIKAETVLTLTKKKEVDQYNRWD